MENTRPCTCGGSNENCAHCFGRGFITDHDKVISTVPNLGFFKKSGPKTKKNATRSSTANQTRVVQCSQCEFLGTVASLASHMAQWHSGTQGAIRRTFSKYKFKKKRKSLASNSTPARELVACPACFARVRPDRLERHVRKVHGANKPAQRLWKKQLPNARVVGADNRNSTAEGENGKAARLDRWKKEVQSSQSLYQKNIDATKLYAHRYRELGRFGSHPSHDGFDDESEA